MEEWKVWKETYSRTWGHITWEVSDQGNVKKNGILYKCKLNKGYKVFGPGTSVHRAVAILFIHNPNNYNEVDHINGNCLDNRACNLRWCTHKQNVNNPITLKRLGGKPRQKEIRIKISKTMKGKNKNKHRVYYDDGTWHMEKNL